MFKGIYKIEKNQLMIAVSMKNLEIVAAPLRKGRGPAGPGSKRPKSFDSTGESAENESVMVYTFKRIK